MSPLAHRIRALRLRQNRTLKEIASQCGFTVSLLSKIESGKTSPPVATLTKIAGALGISMGDLLEEGNGNTSVFTPAEKKPATLTEKGYQFLLLAGERSEKEMQPFLFVARRGEVKAGGLSHCGEEFVYVLSGKMKYRVGATTYTLTKGDSLYFNSEEEHDLEPITAEVCYLAVFCERKNTHRSRLSRSKIKR